MKALLFNVNVLHFIFLKLIGIISGKVFYTGPFATIKLKEIPKPTPFDQNWAIIKVRSCGFCGSDLNLILLKDSPQASPFTSFPCVIGHEICGEVVEVKNGDKIKTGHLVAISPQLSCEVRGIYPPCDPCKMGRTSSCENFAKGNISPGMFIGICRDVNGGFAEYIIAHKTQLFKLPEEIDALSGSLIEPTSVAIQAVLDNKPKDREKILIIGLGVIGNLIMQVIRALKIDCEIYGIDPSMFHATLAEQMGISGIIPIDDMVKEIENITNGKSYSPMIGEKIFMGGFHRIFDTVGTSKTVNLALKTLKTHGTLSLVGISHKLKFDPTPLWLKQQRIIGCFGSSYNLVNGEKKHAFEIAIDLIKKGKIETKKLITHKFTLDEYIQMIETNLDKQNKKAVKTVCYFD